MTNASYTPPTAEERAQAQEYMTVKMALISRIINRPTTLADIASSILTLGFNNRARAWRKEQRDIVELCDEYKVSQPVRKALYAEYELPLPKP